MKINGKTLGGFDKFILMALYVEGALSLKQINDKTIIFISSIWYQQWSEKDKSFLNSVIDSIEKARYFFKKGHANNGNKFEAELGKINSHNNFIRLIEFGLVEKKDDKTYKLTEFGHGTGESLVNTMKKRNKEIDKYLFSTNAVARNNIFVDFLLAVLKLSAGFISGSVGLISDGLDAITDTISAFFVWLGIKFHHEFLSTILVIFMLFVAGISATYESISRIIEILNNTVNPINQVPLVVGVETIAILAAIGLFVYQRHIGRSFNNLTIISQSVDSKNHIFIGSAVIIGAVLSLFNIFWVDAIVGIFIGIGILRDAFNLLKDAKSSYEGEKTDFSKYKTVFGDYMNINHLETFRLWILFAIPNKNVNTQEDLIKSFNDMLNDSYIPVISELELLPNKYLDFKNNFDEVINHLIENNWIKKNENRYEITKSGLEHLDIILSDFDDFDVKFSDSLFLKLSDES
ncbi:cation transporter [Methanobrevibacter sp. TMH8]|uniref:cation transporter n=1 Tax=Methanobrevibacter sp. TMH8 TaxID=2848611 RepID=UPI001CC8FB61|nr:cation transporter [Methanobrevibacter sp. TMH8]MBZ9570616.1 cation transporter [Methanobrevibacter sp. TMH8]